MSTYRKLKYIIEEKFKIEEVNDKRRRKKS